MSSMTSPSHGSDGSSRRLQPVERRRLRDLAYAAIRESIISGAFQTGERLTETHLAAELAMSRAPIREALRGLVREGLVVERPHLGTFVASMSADDVTDLYNVRLGIETVGLRLFMRRREPTEPLWSAIQEMEQAAKRKDIAGVVSAEFEFHRIISERCGSPLLAKLFSDLEGRILMAIALDDATFPELGDVAAEHVPIVEAIDAHDEVRAVAEFEEHLVSTVGELLQRLGGDNSALLGPSAVLE